MITAILAYLRAFRRSDAHKQALSNDSICQLDLGFPPSHQPAKQKREIFTTTSPEQLRHLDFPLPGTTNQTKQPPTL